MNIIFLDVDGVLNSEISIERTGEYIDPATVEILGQIVEKAGAALVLTSSWRGGWSPDADQLGEDGRILVEALAKQGLQIYDKTPFLHISNMSGRSLELLYWLRKHGHQVEHFVILDDVDFHWERFLLDPFWVRTNEENLGLTKSHVDQAVAILSKKRDPLMRLRHWLYSFPLFRFL